MLAWARHNLLDTCETALKFCPHFLAEFFHFCKTRDRDEVRRHAVAKSEEVRSYQCDMRLFVYLESCSHPGSPMLLQSQSTTTRGTTSTSGQTRSNNSVLSHSHQTRTTLTVWMRMVHTGGEQRPQNTTNREDKEAQRERTKQSRASIKCHLR